MFITPKTIGRRLLCSFLAMAFLIILSALIGSYGFSSVAKTERKVVNQAVPAMLEARQVSELSTNIISSVQSLTNATNKKQIKSSGKHVFDQLQKLLMHIKELGSDSFDPKLLDHLETSVQSVIDNLAQLGKTVEARLSLQQQLTSRVDNMRLLAVELEQLTRTQVLNTNTVAIANITHIYDLLKEQKNEEVYQALDGLVEVDLDLSDRLHELHLFAFKILNLIEETKTVTDPQRITELQHTFDYNIKIMMRRVGSVEDPTRSLQMMHLLQQIKQRSIVFQTLNKQRDNELLVEQLKQKNLDLFTQLNTTVSQLIDESNISTNKAVTELTQTLSLAQRSLIIITFLGLLIVGIVIWRVVYISVVKRLSEYSQGLQAIAKGDLDAPINTKGQDEVASMGRAIVQAQQTAKALKVMAEEDRMVRQELVRHREQLEDLITERTQQLQDSNQKLNQEVKSHTAARNEAEQANRAKSAFLATMSHEIRTPMNGVLGTARLLSETRLDHMQKSYVDVINHSGEHLLALLNDILDYSKIEAGHLTIQSEAFDLHFLLQENQRLMQNRAQEKALDLNLTIESNVMAWWLGDKLKITQIMNNLVGNAIKFTHQGYIDVYVSCDQEHNVNDLNLKDRSLSERSSSENNQQTTVIYIEVQDSGVGMSKQELNTIFDAFTQAKEGTKTTGGTGLGLAISKHLVDVMGGTLTVNSTQGEGSCFLVSLPLITSKEVELVSTRAPLNSSLIGSILLIEDNPVNQLVAQGFLTNLSHHVVTASDCQQARDLFAQQQFDIALVDINLPDGNGVELMQQMKAHNSSTCMIAVSAHVFAEEVTRYLEAGFDDYLPKPLNKDDLQARLEHWLHIREDQQSLVLPQDLALSSLSGKSVQPNHKQILESQFIDIEPVKSQTTLIDKKVLLQDIDALGVDLMQSIVKSYISTSLVEVNNLSVLLKKGQCDDSTHKKIQDIVHKLKGSSLSVGASFVANICLNIEMSNEAIQQAKNALSTLNDALAKTHIELQLLLEDI